MAVIPGLFGRAEEIVTEDKTAIAVGSGSLPVYGTPCMIALIEKAACKALAAHLEDGMTSVGTELDVKHTAPTPVGMRVWAEVSLASTSPNGRELTFIVEAFDETGSIGSGIHKRFLVKAEKFTEKCYAKKQV